MRQVAVSWLLVAAWLVAAATADAGRLPVQVFSSADGLSGDFVTCLYQDSLGYLWVGTATGLSRFDGATFVVYTAAAGLPHPIVTDVLEDRHGAVWVATSGGLARLRAYRGGDGKAFDTFTFGPGPFTNNVNDLLEDSRGTLWVASGGVLYREGEQGGRIGFSPVDLGIHWHEQEAQRVGPMAESPDGSLWISTTRGVVRRLPDGRAVTYPVGPGQKRASGDLLVDQDGHLWVAGSGVHRLTPERADRVSGGFELRSREVLVRGTGAAPPRAPAGTVWTWSSEAGLPTDIPPLLSPGRNGAIWLATQHGLFALRGGRLTHMSIPQGLVDERISSCLEDREGNLWLGTAASGLMRVNRGRFISYGAAEGLATTKVASIISDHAGGILAVGFPASTVVHRFDGERFQAVRLPTGDVEGPAGWGENQVTLVDRHGEWWVPTGRALYRFPDVHRLAELEHARPTAIYTKDNGLAGEEVFRVFEDSSGDIWLGVFNPGHVSRWHRASGRFEHFSKERGLPPYAATAFAEDGDGAVWAGFYTGGIARFRDGSVHFFGTEDGVPAGFVTSLHFDHAGRLWVATRRDGVARWDHPSGDEPSWRYYREADGLTSDGVICMAEDALGRLYLGTFRGIDRLDPESGRIRHFDTFDGLASNLVVAAYADAAGDLWFATAGGVSRYHPVAGEEPRSPRAYITEVRVAGVALEVAERGATELPACELPSSRRNLEISFVGVDLGAGDRVRFEYALGAATGPWSAPFPERRVHLAALAPGRYLFRVRAVSPDGVPGVGASFAFHILPPIWRRWWATLLGLGVIGALVGAVHRARMRRLDRLHQTRARIAADLHDELGLSLTRISVLSAVAKRSLGSRVEPAGEHMDEIGETARDLIDATGDMVWALDPRRDDLGSLLARLRRLAGTIFEECGITCVFLERGDIDVTLSPEVRRHLYLILKEAIHNCARHSGARQASLALQVQAGWLLAELSDDGRGLVSRGATSGEGASGGRGLGSMARRASELGGDFAITSSPGEGTRVKVRIPLARRRRWTPWRRMRMRW